MRQYYILILLKIVLLFVLGVKPDVLKKCFKDGDLIIGALFSIHEEPFKGLTHTKTCGTIREQYGVQRVEQFIKTVEELNEDNLILPGIKLGYDIRDTCWYPRIALEQIIDFIKNAITYQDSVADCGKNIDCIRQATQKHKPIAGLIGPAASHVTIPVQNMLQLFHIPQIGYSATLINLSKRDEHEYHFRVVPSDSFQAKLIVDIVKFFNWTYVSLVNTNSESDLEIRYSNILHE